MVAGISLLSKLLKSYTISFANFAHHLEFEEKWFKNLNDIEDYINKRKRLHTIIVLIKKEKKIFW